MKRARDVMRRDPVCVSASAELREVERLFLEKSLTGLPVVDEEGNLVGVVSQTDVVHHDLTRGEPGEGTGGVATGLASRAVGRGYQLVTPDETTAADLMTPVVQTATEDTPVEDLARLMRERHVHRVVVTRGRKVVGLVSSFDLLGLLCGGEGEPPSGRDPE